MREDSLARRYASKLGASLIGLPASLVVQWLAVRALGPLGYGSYTYLNGFFTDVCNFFDAGTSTGFYAKLCARPEEKGLLVFYWRLALAIGLLVLLLTAGLLLLGLRGQIWPGQTALHIVLAALGTLSIWAASIGGKIVDAYGLTTDGEKARLVQRVITALTLALLFLFGWLDLTVFMGMQIVLAIILLWMWQMQLARAGRALDGDLALTKVSSREYTREFWDYSHPLLAFALFAMIAGVTDRWLLQKFAGTAEQGFFGLSQQVGTFCFVFTSSMVPLLAREFSQACQMKDLPRMARDFGRNLTRFYTLSVFIGLFVASQADRVALLLGGKGFTTAGTPMLIMCLYPIHQTYGQLNISVFYATGQTRLHRNIGIIFQVIGLGVTYWFLAPNSAGGWGLGSTGLALKMVLTQIIIVNIQLWFNTRRLNLSYSWFLGHQIMVLALFSVLGFGLQHVVGSFGFEPVMEIGVSAFFYLLIAGMILWSWPQIIDLSRPDIAAGLRRISRFFADKSIV